jgi:phosphate transport system substrate-binding protein
VGLRNWLMPGGIALCAVLAAGCAGPAPVPGPPGLGAAATGAQAGPALPLTPAPGRATVSETGSTLLFPLMRAWAGAYESQHPGITVTTGGTGSGTGIKDASDGSAEIGASDAFLSAGQLVSNPALLNVPLVVSAQQVDYNVPDLSPNVHLNLDGPVLAQMYQGTITAWNDPAIERLNPGVHLPGTPVVPLHRADSSGDTFLFTSYVSTHDPAWSSAIGYGTTVAWPAAPRAASAQGNSGMVTACAGQPGCVAYIGISYLSQALSSGLGEAQLANTLGQYVLPTSATIAAAVSSFVSSTPAGGTISMIDGPAPGGYPIVNYEYAIVSTRQRSAAQARDIRAFLHWAITTGSAAQYLAAQRLVQLPPDVMAQSDAQIEKIR